MTIEDNLIASRSIIISEFINRLVGIKVKLTKSRCLMFQLDNIHIIHADTGATVVDIHLRAVNNIRNSRIVKNSRIGIFPRNSQLFAIQRCREHRIITKAVIPNLDIVSGRITIQINCKLFSDNFCVRNNMCQSFHKVVLNRLHA